jgi:tetratricopeptide (TPR) repeat protein
MPTRVDYPIPLPPTWEAFENLCRDLWAEEWEDSNTQKNGRQGQAQKGVDIFGQPQKKYWAGVQAKEKDQLAAQTISIIELHKEVENAKGFEPKLKEYIIATTGPRDATVQEEARKITEEHKKKDLFDVYVYCWEDIERLIKKHQNVYRLHYPQHFPDLDAVEELTEKIIENQNDNSDNQSDEITNLRLEMQKGFQNIAEHASIGGDISQEHQAELDYAKKLIDEHKSNTAINYLETIKTRIWEQTSSNIRFRILTNIAAANLQLGQEEKAAKQFIEALQYNPEDEKALCNVALAYILLGNSKSAEEYVKKVFVKNPASGRGYSMLIQIRMDTSTPIKKIVDEIPSEYHDLPDIAYALGSAYRKNHLYEKAIKCFERLGKINKEDPEYLVSHATTLLGSVSKGMIISFTKVLDKDEKEKISKATELYEKAWSKIKDYEGTSLKLECLANKGLSYMLLGNTEKAALSFDDVLVIEPNNPSHVFSRALIDYDTNKQDLALERLKKIPMTKDIPAAILICDIYLRKSKENPEILRKEALPIIEEYIKLDPPLFFKSGAERLRIQLHIVLGELKTAAKLADQVVKENPQDINSLVSKSRIHRMLKKDDIADDCLSKAEKLVSKDTQYFDLLALADEYYAIRKFDKAVTFYEKIADVKSDTDITKRLIDCLLSVGNYKRVLAICKSIRDNQGLIREIVELEASLNEEIGDLQEARRLCEEYLKQNSDEKVQLHLASINYRDQKMEDVDSFLRKPFNYEKLLLKHRIQYVELLSVRGFDKQAIKAMYETRKKYFDQSEAHLVYVATLLRDGDKNISWLKPTKVAIDTNFALEDDSGTLTWYLIEERDDIDPAKNELRPNHPLAKKALGKVVGDEIEIISTGPQKRSGKITEVKSKYIHALHNSMQSYQTMFPEAEGLYSINLKSTPDGNIDEESLQVFFNQADEHKKRTDYVENLYKEGKIPIGAVASLLGKNPIEAWGWLMSQENIGIKCSIGDIYQMNEIRTKLNDKPKLVVDITSLMTIHGLSIADNIVKVYGKLLISQTTIDNLTDIVSNRKGIYSKGFFSVGKQGDEYVKTDVTAEQVKENTEYLKGIQKWIEQNCVITPCKEALLLDHKEREQLYKIFGHSFVDSILIAKQEQTLLLSEDERLRSFALGTYKVEGIWTQVIAQQLLTIQEIDSQTYQEMVIKLVNSNYIFTSINAGTLIEAARKSLWKADSSFLKIASLLNGKRCDDVSALRVVSEFMKLLLEQPIYLDDPKHICTEVLDHAIKDRENRKEFLIKLELRLNRLLALSPTKLAEAKQIVEGWLKNHVV